MEQTPNYKLTKPGYEDFGDVDALNGNMDKLDAALKANADALSAQAAAAAKGAQALAAHLADENNPHGVTAPQIGAIAADTLGQPGGPAQLGADGKLPADQLGDVGGGGSLLTLRFDAAFLGCTWTLSGGGETYSGTVDSGLTATASVKGVGTTYTLACGAQWCKARRVPFVDPGVFYGDDREAGADECIRRLLGYVQQLDRADATDARDRPVWVCNAERDGGAVPRGRHGRGQQPL